MANYGPYYGSFGGSFSNVYSQLAIDDWTVTSTQVTFHAYGGYYADYNWSISGISSQLFWGEGGSWYSFYYDDGFSISTGSSGGSDWWIDETGYFTRTSVDRYVYFANDLAFSGNSASAQSGTLTVPHLPSVPSNVKATRQSDTAIKLTWTNPSTSYSKMYIQVSVDGGSWTNVTNINSTTSYTYTSSANHSYKFRIRTYYESAYSDYVSSGTVYTTPSAPTSISAARVAGTDSKVNITINMGSSNGSPQIERKVDGGSWTVLAQPSKTTTSYSDTTTSADHAYQYRLCAYSGSLKSAYVTSSTVTMTPAAPTKITLARSSGTDVLVTLTNNSNVATSLGWQISTDDKATWQDGSSSPISGLVTSFTASGISGTAYIRVRNKNSTGNSAWLVSSAITTLQPPNPPTLRTPSGNVISLQEADVTFSWLHNSVDGSSQTAYQLRYAANGGAWTTVSGTTAQSRTVSTSGWNAGDLITWQVRTKGADASYSDWSDTWQFYTYQIPSLTFTSGYPPSSVTTMPITVKIAYSDPQSMACAAATVYVYKGSTKLYSKSMSISGSTLSATISASQFLPENGETYTVKVTARSASTLQASASMSITTAFTPPAQAYVEITNDTDTGYVELMVVAPSPSAGEEPIASVEVYRVTDHRKQLIEGAVDGTFLTDRYAPLNTDYTYEVVSYAASFAIAVNVQDNRIDTERWFAYWGDNLAWAKWNPSGSYSLARPEKVRVHYAGRKWPVSYDSMAMEQRQSISWTVISLDDWGNGFIQLMDEGGRGVYKGCDGWVYRADFEYTETPNYTSVTHLGEVSLAITRIDGEEL